MSDVAADHAVVSVQRTSHEREKRQERDKDVEAVKTEEVGAPVPQVPDFPEGGLKGWATVAGAYVVHKLVNATSEQHHRCCIQFCGFGYG